MARFCAVAVLLVVASVPFVGGESLVNTTAARTDVAGVAMTVMSRQIQIAIDFVHFWQADALPGSRTIFFISTDSPQEMRDRLKIREPDLVVRSAPDVGDSGNRLHRFHHLLEHEHDMYSSQVPSLYVVDPTADDAGGLMDGLDAGLLTSSLSNQERLAFLCAPHVTVHGTGGHPVTAEESETPEAAEESEADEASDPAAKKQSEAATCMVRS